MNLYLPRLIAIVGEHRNIKDPMKPTWYVLFPSLLTLELGTMVVLKSGK